MEEESTNRQQSDTMSLTDLWAVTDGYTNNKIILNIF
jgi:hypothetical protein